MLGQNRTVVRAVAENANACDFTAGVVLHRSTSAEQALHRIGLDRRRAEAHESAFSVSDILWLHQSQTAETPSGLAR